MADKELERLRAELRKKRNAASAKIGRIEKSIGVDITGTAFDVRPKPERISRYNKAQIRGQIRKLNEFNRRETSFVPGKGSIPIPKSEWEKYKSAERGVGIKAGSEFDKVADLYIGHLGVTVGARRENRSERRRRAGGEATASAFPRYSRSSTDIASVEALSKLTADFNSKLKPGYLPKFIKEKRAELDEMLKTIGNRNFIDIANSLSDHQFNVMWQYTDMAEKVSERYELMKLMAAGRKDRDMNSQVETNESLLNDIFNMAATVPRKPPRKGGQKPANNRRR